MEAEREWFAELDINNPFNVVSGKLNNAHELELKGVKAIKGNKEVESFVLQPNDMDNPRFYLVLSAIPTADRYFVIQNIQITEEIKDVSKLGSDDYDRECDYFLTKDGGVFVPRMKGLLPITMQEAFAATLTNCLVKKAPSWLFEYTEQ